MTIEILQEGNRVASEITQVQAQLVQIAEMIDEAKGSGKVKTRVKGMDFELPKAAFRSEVIKQKKELEDLLAVLEADFLAL